MIFLLSIFKKNLVMKKIGFLLLICMGLIIGGCPYISPVSLGEPDALDSKFLGKWHKEGEEKSHYLFEKTSDKLYKITENKWKEDESKFDENPVIYTGFIKMINNKPFLDLQPTEDQMTMTVNDHMIFGLTMISDSKMEVRPLTERIEDKFTSSADLVDFIKKYQNLSFFYEATEIWEKK